MDFNPQIEPGPAADVSRRDDIDIGAHTGKVSKVAEVQFIDLRHGAQDAGVERQVGAQQSRDRLMVSRNALASLLLGIPDSGSFNAPDLLDRRSKYVGWFAQDEWKISSDLTVNLGGAGRRTHRGWTPTTGKTVSIRPPSTRSRALPA